MELHPEAATELEEAALWYRDRSPIAALALMLEVESAFERILTAPARFPLWLAGSRRCFLPNFPFSVVYQFNEQRLLVLAVAHHRRRPGYWSERAPSRS